QWVEKNNTQLIFNTEPFQQILLKHVDINANQKNKINHNVEFRVYAPFLQNNQQICIVGSIAALHNWDTSSKLIPLSKHKNGYYFYPLLLPLYTQIIQYKYGVFDNTTNRFIQFEDGVNRTVYFENNAKNNLHVQQDNFVNTPPLFFKGTGVAMPVFSLKSNQSGGIGEFNDLKLLVDWCKKTNIKLIQILPINDTTSSYTWKDSYPYAAISAFALHPIYIHLDSIFNNEQNMLKKAWLEEKNTLNNLKFVDYESVLKLKWKYIQILYKKNADTYKLSPTYNDFFEKNKHWLIPYSVFCYLRDKNNTANFNNWAKYALYNESEMLEIYNKISSIQIHIYVQFLLHQQLLEATNYAHKNNIIIKGDIAIGVARYGVDVWQNPPLFNTHFQAGAPPDDFSVKGQNWNFPTYNWQVMEENNFDWWKKRFNQMNYYFDAFRIDHILGFFRIWSIPIEQIEGLMGYFIPAIPILENDLKNHHIYQKIERFTKPYINQFILQEIFGEKAIFIEENFLDNINTVEYTLKPEFSTQVLIEKNLPLIDNYAEIKQGLFELVSNIILIQDNYKNAYHFRFFMQKTTSFKHLDDFTKAQLLIMYNHYFFVSQEKLWKEEALKKLPKLKESTNMLICGEDLGLVPTCVPEVMNQLSILSLEVQRMPKITTEHFSNPLSAPYLSVVTVSSHDTSTIRGWWEEDRSITQLYYNHILNLPGVAPYFCEDWIIEKIIHQHVHSPAMWAIFQLQDFFGIYPTYRVEKPGDERINIPANPNHFWKYRMHLNLEELILNDDFNDKIKRL
ncbi:MAG: 4-alpha-glucanotransferase, partial [Sediminibacterium sp.]|nr:4-alpha-glucanotransferase [Sediminibacterium sp.]